MTQPTSSRPSTTLDAGRVSFYRRPPQERRTRGPGKFAGRLPKGWKRSDQRILDDVAERFARSEHADASDVSIEVRDGTVILEGTVPQRHMRWTLEDLAAEVLGVHDVENRIRATWRDVS